LAVGLCPDSLWELKPSPNPLAAIWGLLLRGGKGRGGSGRREVGGRKGEEKEEDPQTRLSGYASVSYHSDLESSLSDCFCYY